MNIKTILIIGISGGLAQSTCEKLIKNDPQIKIVGIDNRLTNTIFPKQIEVRKMRYSRSQFEKLFREIKFDCVVHLARISHSENISHNNYMNRLNFNLIGTKTILNLCLKFKVKKFVFLSTFHVYGALSDNPVYLTEESSLRASLNYPELRDVVEMDQIVSSWMWQHQNEIQTIVLRPCNIVGPTINNTISEYFKTNFAPIPIDFNPTFQFIHQEDMARVIMNSINHFSLGIFNCAPDDTITLNEVSSLNNKFKTRVPISIIKQIAKLLNSPIWSFPLYLIDYVTFSCIIDSKLLRSKLPENSLLYTSREAIKSILS